jgi:hypothetical protein
MNISKKKSKEFDYLINLYISIRKYNSVFNPKMKKFHFLQQTQNYYFSITNLHYVPLLSHRIIHQYLQQLRLNLFWQPNIGEQVSFMKIISYSFEYVVIGHLRSFSYFSLFDMLNVWMVLEWS